LRRRQYQVNESREGRGLAPGGYEVAAEQYVVERVNQLIGWSAVNANLVRANQPGFDVVARHRGGRELRISVKSVSTGGKRHDYGIGRRNLSTILRRQAELFTESPAVSNRAG
jgi:hypothetical protein